MELAKHMKKMDLLMKNVCEGKIVLTQYNTEKLLKLLEDSTENSPSKLLLDAPYFSDIISRSLENMSNACTMVKVFLIDILTILFKNELQFAKMRMQGYRNFSYKLCILDNLNTEAHPSLHLRCIKLVTMQVTHCSGLCIIREHKVWKYILYPNIHKKPKQIAKAAYNFLSNLVWRLNEFNREQELIEVLKYVVDPIVSNGYTQVQVLDTEADVGLSDMVIPYICTLEAVLTDADNYPPVNNIISLLKEYFIIQPHLIKLFKTTKNSELLKLLNSCLFRFTFQICRHLLFSGQIDEFCNKMTAFHRNVTVEAVKKREAIILVDFVIQSIIIWSNFKKRHESQFNFPLTFERNGTKYEFCLQILVHLLVPLIKCGALYKNTRELQMTDVIEKFMAKMGRALNDYIVTSCYLFGDYLEECTDTFRTLIAIHTMKELLRMKEHITKSQAGPIFQSLYYLLEIFIKCDETGRLVETEIMRDVGALMLLSNLLDVLNMLLKGHNIPWNENLEIVNIQADLLNLLKQSFLTTKHVVQVLDLLNICVKKFLSPNMTLLVESKKDTTMNEISKIINLYSQHEFWEVRDSALNLLNTCTEISFIKYVPLQKMIRNNNLIILAAKLALNDPEFYSQCVALKCLTAATKIYDIWKDVLLDNADLHLHLIYLVRNHSEGMVRKEIVNVLTGVFANQKLEPNFLNTLYGVILMAARDDLHWEVQLAALNFWKTAIQKDLSYGGMIDGKFPPVTFSKEKRKIVVLDTREIHRQLNGIMNHLASIGCLTALLECMNDINNIEVMEKAYSITKDLVNILDKYKFQYIIENVKTEPAEVLPQNMEHSNFMLIDLSCPNEDERNRVIDSILSLDQNELIINVHNSYDRSVSEGMDIDYGYCPPKKLDKPNEFLEKFKNINYSLIIENKKNYAQCVSTLDGVLDEMLAL